MPTININAIRFNATGKVEVPCDLGKTWSLFGGLVINRAAIDAAAARNQTMRDRSESRWYDFMEKFFHLNAH